MNEGLIPSRYAKALYKYAQEHHVAAPIYEEMKRLDAAFATHTELSKALSNPALSAADKVRVLSSAFGEKPDDYLLRFVQLVIRNRRETFARAIALAYQDIYRRANHIARVTITTAVALDKEVLDRIGDLMKKQTDKTLEFVYEIDPSIIGGFILRVDSMQLEASVNSELKKLRLKLLNSNDMIKPSEISDILKKQLDEVDSKINFEEVGTVLEVGDGVAHVYGLENVRSSELIEFENGVHGVAMNLEESNVGVILLDNVDKVTENMTARRTGEIASLPVGEGLLGRVINTLGEPIDGAGPIQGDLIRLPLERKAPGVIFRQPVNEPLQTGIKAIDSMVPIGRGQRELIIGDRQIGKTAIAIDTIINQRDNYKNGNPLYCIYVAIGQKASSVAALVNTLKEHGALDYTVVLAANASDSAAMRYYAPFAGAAIGEYFRDSGRHALVIYDDLSKQAVSYREISLILRRPSGREAYPGDIFYLHSRLLERAAKIINNDEVASSMNDLPEVMKPMVKGGGSLTALPIIETQAGDVSAYIPTNVISITDGQIFLETALFNQGVRPAINVGISVSRVGGNAQVKAMKKIAGTLKIDQAQFRELESFTKFGGDVDPVTAMTIDKGRKNERILIQPQYSPVPVEEEIAIIYCGTQGLLHNVPMDKVAEFEKLYLQILKSKYSHEVMDELRAGHLDDKIAALMTEVAEEVANRFKA